MKRNTRMISGIALVVFVAFVLTGIGIWWAIGHRGSQTENTEKAAKGEAAEKGDAAAEVVANALVKTESVKQQSLPMTMTVFGEVATGKVEALSFAQAGQLEEIAVVAGQPVHRGDLMAKMVSDPTSQIAYAQAVTAVGFAQRELRRNHELLALQLATQSQVDTAEKQLQDAQASLAAQTKLGGAQESARLLAPFDAVVMATPVGQGERVQAGAAVVQLGHSDTLRVQLAVEPAQSTLLHVGMPVAIAAVQDSSRAVSASISAIQNVVDPKTQLVSAIVVLPSGKHAQLLPGMHVQAVIQLGKRVAWSVPRQAVLTDDKGAYLFQVAGGKAQRVDVNKLVETGALFGVEGKLDPQLPVVVLGNYELEEGMAVREGAR